MYYIDNQQVESMQRLRENSLLKCGYTTLAGRLSSAGRPCWGRIVWRRLPFRRSDDLRLPSGDASGINGTRMVLSANVPVIIRRRS